MFKKPLSGTKTSAPLRGSDRRKLRQRIVTTYGISPEDADLLVTDPILSIKFSTHLDESGVAYLSPNGDPLWFTVGKGSLDLIPTIYTLWKRQDLLPTICTDASVIPILVGGADLMIPGVVQHTPSLQVQQLVSILQHNRDGERTTVSPPLAVGRMALPSDHLGSGLQEKGKAVLVLHTWKDHLWEMGSKIDAPEATPADAESSDEPLSPPTGNDIVGNEVQSTSESPTTTLSNITTQPSETVPLTLFYTPEEVTTLLHTSLIQAISSSIPTSSFPISSTLFYTDYILPSRPAFPSSILPHSGSSIPDASPLARASEITIKSSTYKSLTTFLKAAEKLDLLVLKSSQKHSKQPDLLITSVNENHPSVEGHIHYASLKDIEAKAARKALQEHKAQGIREVEVTELWKPHLSTISVFEAMGEKTNDLYSFPEVKALLNSYISAKSLVNPYQQAYINLDELLATCVSKPIGKSKSKDVDPEPVKYMRREGLVKAILDHMQDWHEVRVDGQDVVRRKGPIAPIQVTVKVRQGRKASTSVVGFELFLVVDAEEMAEELRKVCAGATSISPVLGKPANTVMEVLVQGKQSKAVVDYLTGRGVPKKWIEVHDTTGKK